MLKRLSIILASALFGLGALVATTPAPASAATQWTLYTCQGGVCASVHTTNSGGGVVVDAVRLSNSTGGNLTGNVVSVIGETGIYKGGANLPDAGAGISQFNIAPIQTGLQSCAQFRGYKLGGSYSFGVRVNGSGAC